MRMEANTNDLLCKPISLSAPIDFTVLKEIIGFFGHENRMELWAEPESVRFRKWTFFSSFRPALLVFPDWRIHQGEGIALLQKERKGSPQLWMYRCRDSLLSRPSPYFTLLAARSPQEEEAETRQMEDIIRCSVREYFEPEY